MIDLKTEVSTLRMYQDPLGYDNRDSPVFSCTVHYISDTEVYICNAVGMLDRAKFRKILEYFKSYGFLELRYERRHKLKLIKLE